VLSYDRELLGIIDDSSQASVNLDAKPTPQEVNEAIRSASQAVKLREKTIDDLIGAIDDLTTEGYEVRRAQSILQSLGAPALGCENAPIAGAPARTEWETANPELAKKAKRFLDALTTHCKQEKDARDKLQEVGPTLADGLLKNAHREWAEGQSQLEGAEKAAFAKKAQYDLAVKAYNDELKRAEPGTSVSERVKEQAAKVGQALDALQTVGAVFGVEIASKERLDRLNELIGSLTTGKELDAATASKAELVASMLPMIADRARAIGQSNKGKALVPLLIQRDIEQANLNAARVETNMLRQRVALREAAFNARARQAFTLFNAHNWASQVMSCDPELLGSDQVDGCRKVAMNRPVHEIWDSLPPRGKRTLLESITQYLDAYARQGGDIDVISTRELALAQERNLMLSEVNAGMWSTLIDATVNQSAEFAALGLKADHFEKLLNILGVFYIGRGVNK
jgi:hypothetical protein